MCVRGRAPLPTPTAAPRCRGPLALRPRLDPDPVGPVVLSGAWSALDARTSVVARRRGAVLLHLALGVARLSGQRAPLATADRDSGRHRRVRGSDGCDVQPVPRPVPGLLRK